MRKRIKGKLCDTDTAQNLGIIFFGEFGDPTGFEERLYVTKTKQHFIYGMGGPDSKYPGPTLALLTDKEADVWKKENIKRK